jgi:glycosyltransferase involved in cell wall biosynthesis
MTLLKKKKGYVFFFDPSKSTSGQRFFLDLYHELKTKTIKISDYPEAILFNVSAPLNEILKAKLRGQIVVLRIDSLYFDELSKEFVSSFHFTFRILFKFFSKVKFLENILTELANFVQQNYTSFARILLSDLVIYQSQFSKKVHEKYFPNKPNVVIVNGTSFKFKNKLEIKPRSGKAIKLITTYDEHRPSKRIHDIVNFVKWAKFEKKVDLELVILGYTGKEPNCTGGLIQREMLCCDFIRAIPRFDDYNENISDLIYSSDMYITFSYRDACPNAIIEAMSFGLPVIGIESGGLPDIVGFSGVLIPNDDFKNGFFSSHRFTCNFPEINFEVVLEGLFKIWLELPMYKNKVHNRFIKDLDIKVVSDRYDNVINEYIAARNGKK